MSMNIQATVGRLFWQPKGSEFQANSLLKIVWYQPHARHTNEQFGQFCRRAQVASRLGVWQARYEQENLSYFHSLSKVDTFQNPE